MEAGHHGETGATVLNHAEEPHNACAIVPIPLLYGEASTALGMIYLKYYVEIFHATVSVLNTARETKVAHDNKK